MLEGSVVRVRKMNIARGVNHHPPGLKSSLAIVTLYQGPWFIANVDWFIGSIWILLLS